MTKIRIFMSICTGLIIGGMICLGLSTSKKEDMTNYEICSICNKTEKTIDKDGNLIKCSTWWDKDWNYICDDCIVILHNTNS